MSYENKGKSISLIADAAYNTRYIAVKKNAVAEGFTLCGAGETPIGILQDITPAGKAAPVMIDGISFMVAGAVLAAGASVAVGAAGKAVAVTQGVAPIGITMNASTAVGDIISVLIKPIGNATTNSMVMSYTSSDLAAGADLSGAVICAAPFAGTVVGVKVISTGSAAGIDASNTSVFAIKNGSATVATITFNDATVFPASGAVAELTLDADHVALAAGDIITLDVTNGATADLPVFIVQLAII